ncbi:MAG: hypothetical protein GDA44_02525 [Prochloron sp. SP5CPC1]|nr:hypothetical protein [Candidatus Paraprochloron terpiosi SP5CPC1]
MNFYELLQTIKQNPNPYISRNSIFDFQAFYNGYSLTKSLFNLPITEEEQKFEDFLNWIMESYSPIELHCSWATIIFIYSADEIDGLKKLFELFEEYLEQQEEKMLESSEDLNDESEC